MNERTIIGSYYAYSSGFYLLSPTSTAAHMEHQKYIEEID